jgi:predicted dehydrogenase
LRVVKELHGRPTDVSPRGALARESAFIQSYRAELAHFVAVISGDAEYEAPTDQVLLHRIVEAIYKSADEGREIKL